MALIQHPATGFDIGDPDRIPLSRANAPKREDVLKAAKSLVLSASGWRKVFAAPSNGKAWSTADDWAPWARGAVDAEAVRPENELAQMAEDSLSPAISAEDKVLCALMAKTFADFLCGICKKGPDAGPDARVKPAEHEVGAVASAAASRVARPAVILGIDSRPTGPAMADVFARVFIGMGIDVHYCYIIAAPEIMAFAASSGRLPPNDERHADGFVYISASHNPPGHNGVKFGLSSGGVLPSELVEPLIASFKTLVNGTNCVELATELVTAASSRALSACYVAASSWKRQAISAYTLFTHEVVTGKTTLGEQGEFLDALAKGCQERPIGVVGELNGSARSLSIDKDYLEGLGVETRWFNDRPGMFAHRIVPEGDSLLPCAAKLEAARDSDPAFELGYVPDCDGDRGNLVYYDKSRKKAVPVEAQEVFALSCVAELATMALEAGGQRPPAGEGAGNEDTGAGSESAGASAKVPRVAIVVNDATSMRIEKIARRFGAQVFRAETGEANVVALADSLRARGWTVRILGEGSNGGNITYPSRVRDPLATVSAILKLLRYKDKATGMDPFRVWLELSESPSLYRPDYGLSEVMATLPAWSTTSVFEDRAMFKIKSPDHAALKAAYRSVFLREWEKRKATLHERFCIESWRALATNGTSEKDVSPDFAQAGKGGLRIVFSGSGGDVAFLWMRGSGTEPVLRIMADIDGGDREDEAYLLDWQTQMVKEADKG